MCTEGAGADGEWARERASSTYIRANEDMAMDIDLCVDSTHLHPLLGCDGSALLSHRHKANMPELLPTELHQHLSMVRQLNTMPHS